MYGLVTKNTSGTLLCKVDTSKRRETKTKTVGGGVEDENI